MIPGSPLEWLWNHPEDGFREPQRDQAADEILKRNEWDVLILQPFGREPENSIEYGSKYAAAAYAGNPDCQVMCLPIILRLASNRKKGRMGRALAITTDTRGRASFEKVAKDFGQFP